MTDSYYYSNTAIPQSLGADIGLSDTSIYMQSTPSGYPGQYPFKLRLTAGSSSEEVVKIVGGSGTLASPWIIGTVLGVASVGGRAWDGTLASAHSEGDLVKHGMTQEDLQYSRAHEASDSTVLDGSQSPAALPHGLPAGAWLPSGLSVISEQQVTGAAPPTLITFAAIPQTFKHLLLVLNARLSGTAAQPGSVSATVNQDSAARYGHLQIGAGFSTGSLPGVKDSSDNSQSSWTSLFDVPTSVTGSAVNSGGGMALFVDYTNATFNKLVLGMSGFGFATSAVAYGNLRWCYYNPVTQAAITEIDLTASSGNFVAGSTATLYGIGG